MKFLKYLILSLFIAVLLAVGTGFYMKWFTENSQTGMIIIGIAVLVSSFIMMPLFLYYSWKGKKIQDYLLTKEKIKDMQKRNFND